MNKFLNKSVDLSILTVTLIMLIEIVRKTMKHIVNIQFDFCNVGIIDFKSTFFHKSVKFNLYDIEWLAVVGGTSKRL